MCEYEVCYDIFKDVDIIELKKVLYPEAPHIVFKPQSKKEENNTLILPAQDPREKIGFKRIMLTLQIMDKKYETDYKLTKLLIIPIGYIRYCHCNAKKTALYLNIKFKTNKWVVAKGYTFGVCRCGISVIGEVHSVLKNNETGELYDITPDYMKSVKHHYFIESSYITNNYTNIFGFPNRELDLITSVCAKDHTKGMCEFHSDCNYKNFLKII